MKIRRATLLAVATGFTLCANSAAAAYVQFRNCLEDSIVNSSPRLLQFIPLNVTASFDSSADKHPLNITVYGNVTGQATIEPYPSADDPRWTNPNSTFGKIVDLSVANNKYTTLFSRLNVLSYTPYNAQPSRFCSATINKECPLAPAFHTNSSDLRHLPAFTIAHDMYSTYAFTSITATFRVQSGDASGQYYACVSATITPDLGVYLRDLLRYLPLGVLITVGVATITAATLSPWGTTDIFHWSSNFGRDEDVLRLVTPGFGDCLQYIQFVILTGSLSINYPGFYQPVVSRVGWSALMFNESFVSGGGGVASIVDGVYQVMQDSNRGLDRMGQLIGMTSSRDIWAGMMVWLVVIIAAVIVLTQIGFALRWAYRQIARIPAEDLRSKNGPFTTGNIIRVVFNCFLLPLVSLSFFQLIIATRGPTYAVGLAAVVLVAILAFCVGFVLLFIRTRPRSFLFDDLLTVLTYGPLYNTYSDDAATFALMPIIINFLRGVAIGAIQASGVAQLVLLAICEIILILTINAVRPFPAATSMNVYHVCFSVIRLITILLSIAFVPSLDINDDARGWLGYAILLIHACVLVFGFFLNAVQTLVEVIARLAGAGGGGAARGGLTKVFGMRQLSRRMPRRDETSRQSMASGAAMLQVIQDEPKSVTMDRSRTHSLSASSTMLLDGNNRGQMSPGFGPQSPGQISMDGTTLMSRPANNRMSGSGSIGGIVGIHKARDAQDPYYRPPRRNTNDASTSGKRPLMPARDSTKDGIVTTEAILDDDAGEGASTMARLDQEDLEEGGHELTKTKTDYAVREVDFYYGVRGPALSSGNRKLKTGPADPTAPTFSSSGWFNRLLPWKAKEKTKGFEVVRSARAPPPGLFPPTRGFDRDTAEPYHDDPQTVDDGRKSLFHSKSNPDRPPRRTDERSVAVESDEDSDSDRVPSHAPSLPRITSVGAIELPSRLGSEASKKSRKKPPKGLVPDVPPLPRKSSRRDSSRGSREILDLAMGATPYHAVATTAYPPTSFPAGAPRPGNLTPNSSSSRLPFQSNSTRKGGNNRHSTGAESTTSSVMPNIRDHSDVDEDENMLNTSGSAKNYATHLRNKSLSADITNDRPSSVGFVQQHRASDNIRYNPATPEFEGSTAEIFDRAGKAK